MSPFSISSPFTSSNSSPSDNSTKLPTPTYSHNYTSLIGLDASRLRTEAKRLEDRVAKIAAKRCSVNEVEGLMRELVDWLKADALAGGGESQVCFLCSVL